MIHAHETVTRPRRTVGFLPVVAALSGNFLITIAKFAGFLVSGSSALFSETMHSLADTLNQALLLVGLVRAKLKPTAEFSYGFGRERFLWALISACCIFFLGATVTVWHGLQSLWTPHEVHLDKSVFLILFFSFVVEGMTLLFAVRETRRGGKEDPVTLAVLFEDSVAVVGVVIATLSILLTYATGNPLWDALGAIIVGLMLGWVAVVLIKKNRAYLITKSMPEDMRDEVIEILEADPMIERVVHFKSSTLDIGVYRITCDVEFNGSIFLKELSKRAYLKKKYELVKNDYQEFLQFCGDVSDRIPRMIGDRINKIEANIKKKFPEVEHIDIEIN